MNQANKTVGTKRGTKKGQTPKAAQALGNGGDSLEAIAERFTNAVERLGKADARKGLPLSFVRTDATGRTSYWAVKPTGDIATDIGTGKGYARELFEWIGTYGDDPFLLSYVMADISVAMAKQTGEHVKARKRAGIKTFPHLRGPVASNLSGIEAGFFSELAGNLATLSKALVVHTSHGVYRHASLEHVPKTTGAPVTIAFQGDSVNASTVLADIQDAASNALIRATAMFEIIALASHESANALTAINKVAEWAQEETDASLERFTREMDEVREAVGARG